MTRRKSRKERIAGAVVSVCDLGLMALAVDELVVGDMTTPLVVARGVVSFTRQVAMKFAY